MAPCCPGDELVLLAALIAMSLSRDLDTETLNVFGCFYSALGQNLSTIAAKRQLCKELFQNDTKT